MKAPPFAMNGILPNRHCPTSLHESIGHGVLDRRGIPTHADGRLLTLTQRWALARKLSKQTK